MSAKPSRIESLPVDDLHLDVNNPRLPEEYIGKPESVILRYLYDKENLEEIARSVVNNGFFVHEPLLVREDPSPAGTLSAERRFITLEGNRRLSTLKILRGDALADGITFDGIELPPGLAEALHEVPCVQVDDPRDILPLLGYRHIEGARQWSSEAKARFLLKAVDESVVEAPAENPFRAVGRRIGSNATGVRNLYVALKTLRAAKEDLGLDAQVNPVLEKRFGVWQRCLNSPDFRKYIGYDDPAENDYAAVKGSLARLQKDHMQEVLGDLAVGGVLRDSRDATDYGKVLMNPEAREVLRRTNSLDDAKRLLRVESLALRIDQTRHECERLRTEIEAAAEVEDDVRAAVTLLHRVVKGMAGAVA